MSAIHDEVRNFLITNVFQGKDTGELTNDTKLISSRLVDSIIALKMVSHLEAKFNIEFEAHEVTQENLDTIDTIAAFVAAKQK